MTNINDVIANELVRRVRKLSTEDLLAMVKNGAAGARKKATSRSGLHRIELPRVVKAGPETVTIGEAVMQTVVGAKKALSTGEIVAGVLALRPDAQEPTVRAEISKRTTDGLLLRHGPRVGGAYTAAQASPKLATG